MFTEEYSSPQVQNTFPGLLCLFHFAIQFISAYLLNKLKCWPDDGAGWKDRVSSKLSNSCFLSKEYVEWLTLYFERMIDKTFPPDIFPAAFSARRGNPQHRPACFTVNPASGPNLLLYCPFLGWTGEFALNPRPLGCVLWTGLRLFLLSLIHSLTVTHPSTQLIAAFCFLMAGVNLPALLLICVC